RARARRPQERSPGDHGARPAGARRHDARADRHAEPRAARLLERGGAGPGRPAQARARQRGGGSEGPGLLPLRVPRAWARPRGTATRSAMVDPSSLEAEKSLSSANSQASWPELDWWKRFGDPQLDALEEEGLAGSPGIRLARARVDQALAAAQVAGAVRKPQISATGDLTRHPFSQT